MMNACAFKTPADLIAAPAWREMVNSHRTSSTIPACSPENPSSLTATARSSLIERCNATVTPPQPGQARQSIRETSGGHGDTVQKAWLKGFVRHRPNSESQVIGQIDWTRCGVNTKLTHFISSLSTKAL